MLKQRLLTTLWSLPLVVAAIWFGDPWFTSAMALCGLFGGWEFYRMAEVKAPPVTYLGLAWILLFVISPHFDSPAAVLLTSAMVLSFVWLIMRRKNTDALVGWALTVAGILYVGLLLSHLVALGIRDGRGWVLLALLTTFASDSAAYFVGRAWGKHPLAPTVSPHKTLEGALGGVVAAVVVSPLLVAVSHLSLNMGWAMLIGVVTSVSGQLGDLSLSLLKRSIGVKDAGKIFPGHGGMLDRLNSVLFAGAAVYYFVALARWAGWM